MIRLQDILSRVEHYHAGADLDLVKKAYVYASSAHEGQTRKSGEPYVVHPLGVASILADLRLDVPSVCAGLLHDCVEDTQATVEDLRKLFGPEVAFLVDGVTKLGKIPWNTREDQQAENFRKMLLAMAKDLRVILIKLADRTDNMRTLGPMPPDKQERIARETMDIYAPLANRLGIQWIKCELEDLAFQYLYPAEWGALRELLLSGERERRQYMEETERALRRELDTAGLRCEIRSRVKHLWSLHQKMRRTGRDLEQIYDIVAFRVLTGSVGECYQVLGVVHNAWTPIPGRFKDFIALPKPNLYQSLHTSVIGPRGERMEVQIRTQEMDRMSEEGIAAHWRYKEGKPLSAVDDKKFSWLRQLMEWQRDLRDPTEFMESVRIDLFEDEVYVFTPRGDVRALPKGSTPIDFSYSIHSQVGDHCSGARVNGLIVPLRYQLRNGDTVEILTNPSQRPNKDWLKFCVTSRAKAKIRHFIRAEQRERGRMWGQELLERELRRFNLSYAKLVRSGQLDQAAKASKAANVEELLVLLGYGKLSAAEVVEQIVPNAKVPPTAEPQPVNPLRELFRRVSRPRSSGIKVQGEDDILVRFGKCCGPLPGDPIVGMLTRGRGVTIHTKTCEMALNQDPDNCIEVAWDVKIKSSYPVSLQVVCANRPGLLASISQAFVDAGVNISQAHCRATEDQRAINTFQFPVSDVDQLRKVVRSIQKVQGVYSVDRVGSATRPPMSTVSALDDG